MAEYLVFPRRSIAEAVDQYVHAKGGNGLVSVRDAVRSLRYLYPKTEHTDSELADLVASSAVRTGCNVAFDLKDEHWPDIIALPR